MIQLKRVYDPVEKEDGRRFLVDRVWPRGIKKETLQLESWLKEVGPTTQLRKWFGHDPGKWKEFEQRFFAELDQKPEAWQPLLEAAKSNKITLLFSSHETQHNNAVALKAYLEKHLAHKR